MGAHHITLSDTRKTADVCGSNYPHWGRPGRTYCQAYRRQCGVRVVGAPEIRTPLPRHRASAADVCTGTASTRWPGRPLRLHPLTTVAHACWHAQRPALIAASQGAALACPGVLHAPQRTIAARKELHPPPSGRTAQLCLCALACRS